MSHGDDSSCSGKAINGARRRRKSRWRAIFVGWGRRPPPAAQPVSAATNGQPWAADRPGSTAPFPGCWSFSFCPPTPHTLLTTPCRALSAGPILDFNTPCCGCRDCLLVALPSSFPRPKSFSCHLESATNPNPSTANLRLVLPYRPSASSPTLQVCQQSPLERPLRHCT